ncbi:hypothetical protein F3Y22_tig00117048pilonHSYRG00380 [Hibiscus syriacus]|uniref:1,3-beta-glucan synthase component FKS1-like domain-containing protein n=1 Tax=Hibiscus syriacus TaxID=106335 RepID=A0A6A2W9P1_HIBSY|nr:hypothetical protein F3Y22_tig00117048pilonHSYRG00380 [Hibiscus syriacus]
MAFELYGMLAGNEAERSREKSKHSQWRNYDDLNEYFWSVDCFRLGWPMRTDADFFCRPDKYEDEVEQLIKKNGFCNPNFGIDTFGLGSPPSGNFRLASCPSRLAVKEELLKQGVAGIVDTFCPLCGKFLESVLCTARIAVWFVARFPDVIIPFDSLMGDPKVADFAVSSKKANSSLTRWVPPPSDFVKLNVDGATVKGWSRGGIGGLLRDNDGVLFGSFLESVGPGPPILAELWQLKEICFYLWCPILIQGEAYSRIGLFYCFGVDKKSGSLHSVVRVIGKIYCFSLVKHDVIVRHILRSANWEADGLAKDGIG